MQRIAKLTLETASGKAKEILTSLHKAMGAEINIFGTFAQAPAALEGYVSLNGALSNGKLAAPLREKIALATAGFNGCDYCASAHTFLGGKAGIDENELVSNLKGQSLDAKDNAALTFAVALIKNRGHIQEADLQAVRAAGFSDEEIVEILSHVALNTFTNYFNEAFKVEIDFPVVSTKETSQAA